MPVQFFHSLSPVWITGVCRTGPAGRLTPCSTLSRCTMPQTLLWSVVFLTEVSLSSSLSNCLPPTTYGELRSCFSFFFYDSLFYPSCSGKTSGKRTSTSSHTFLPITFLKMFWMCLCPLRYLNVRNDVFYVKNITILIFSFQSAINQPYLSAMAYHIMEIPWQTHNEGQMTAYITKFKFSDILSNILVRYTACASVLLSRIPCAFSTHFPFRVLFSFFMITSAPNNVIIRWYVPIPGCLVPASILFKCDSLISAASDNSALVIPLAVRNILIVSPISALPIFTALYLLTDTTIINMSLSGEKGLVVSFFFATRRLRPLGFLLFCIFSPFWM